MRVNVPRYLIKLILPVTGCLIITAIIFSTGLAEFLNARVDESYQLFWDRVLLSSVFISIFLIVLLIFNYRSLHKEVKFRKQAEKEVRILRQAEKARTAEILQALDDKEFKLYLQPIVSLKDGKICGFEALIRWHHQVYGTLYPASFMPFVEERDLIVPLTKYILHECAALITDWRKSFPDVHLPMMCINVSWQHNHYSDLVKDISDVLAEYEEFVPGYFCLELTETTAAQNIEKAISLTTRLRELGVSISLDDFGTGYSSLSYLGNLPLTCVKIDRSFVKQMLVQTRSDIVVRSIIKMSQELDLKVIAEGIETPEQHQHLIALGCGYGQGYLFSRPVLEKQAREMIIYGKTTLPEGCLYPQLEDVIQPEF